MTELLRADSEYWRAVRKDLFPANLTPEFFCESFSQLQRITEDGLIDGNSGENLHASLPKAEVAS